jgi:hypothetical protein
VDTSGVERAAPVEPLTHYFVGRAVRDFRRGGSAIGGIVTATNRDMPQSGGDDLQGQTSDLPSRLASAAYTGGVDARHRFGGDNFEIRARAYGSHVRGRPEAIARIQRSTTHTFHRPDADHLRYDPARTSLTGGMIDANVRKIGGGHWRWRAGTQVTSPGFEINDLGFYLWSDAIEQYVSVGYEQFRPGRLLRSWELSGFQRAEWSFGGERRNTVFDLTGRLTLNNLWGTTAWVQHDLPAVSTDALRGGPALATPARSRAYLSVNSDRRKALSGSAFVFHDREAGTGGRSLNTGLTLALRPSPRAELSLAPRLLWRTHAWQYVTGVAAEDRTHYVMARLEHATASLTGRLSFAFTPNVSLQLYAQPFLSAGAYSGFLAVRDPRAPRFEDRFHRLSDDEIAYEPASRRYEVGLNADGTADFSFADPDFNVREFQSNLVLRWEWRPGSTLFVAWNRGQADDAPDGVLRPWSDARALFRTDPTDVLPVKINYWIDL